MSLRYYRLLYGFAASLSLVLGGCGSNWPNTYVPAPAPTAVPAAAAPIQTAVPAPTAVPAAAPQVAKAADQIDTEATIWTVLGMAKRESDEALGPRTGNSVSPVLWQAAQETLHFAGFAAEDPMSGLVLTNWYSPPGKPYERLRVGVFILSRALRSDSLAVTVERQTSSTGKWQDAPVARDVVTGLENEILLRARQIHAERYRETMYK